MALRIAGRRDAPASKADQADSLQGRQESVLPLGLLGVANGKTALNAIGNRMQISRHYWRSLYEFGS